MPKLIIGCGYVGFRVARRWLDDGETVYALTRSPARGEELAAAGITPVIGDVTRTISLPQIDKLDTVLYAVGFDRSSSHSIEEVYVDGFARALAALPLDFERLIYISSTGVYGQTDGEWIDEESPCEPQRPGGKAVLAAEQLLAEHALADRGIVLRLAGIYGPKRVPKLRDVRRGEPLTVDETAFLNLIHVDDVVQAILAAEGLGELPARYLIGDGCPVRRGVFYTELASQLGAAPPQFVKPTKPSSQTRAAGSKRVRNTRMLASLVPHLLFPSFREGLADVIRADLK